MMISDRTFKIQISEHEGAEEIPTLLKNFLSQAFPNVEIIEAKNNLKVSLIENSDMQHKQYQKDIMASIAHEFNNPLAVIEGLMYLFSKEEQADNKNNYMNRILANLERLKLLVQHLRDFSDVKLLTSNKDIEINQIIQESFTFFSDRLHEIDLEYQLNLSEDNPILNADLGEIQRIIQIKIFAIVNYFKNKNIHSRVLLNVSTHIHKVKDDHEIEIIFTETLPLTKKFLFEKQLIEITKAMENILQRYTASIEEKISEGQRKTILRFPMCQHELENEKKEILSPIRLIESKLISIQNESNEPIKKTKISKLSVLIIDDDPDICDLLSSYLDHKKFDIMTTFSPHEALNMIKKLNFDLIIADYKMPLMSGVEIFMEASKDQINRKYILMSGFNIEAVHDELKKIPVRIAHLHKPFGDPATIKSYIEDVLNSD